MGILANSTSVTHTSSAATDTNDGYFVDEQVTLTTDPALSGGSVLWTLTHPAGGGSARLSDPGADSPTIAPDVEGDWVFTARDGTTVYQLTLTVEVAEAVQRATVIELVPVADDDVRTPASGKVLYASTDSSGDLSIKGTDGVPERLGSPVGETGWEKVGAVVRTATDGDVVDARSGAFRAGTSPAGAGAIRLANAAIMRARNAADSADLDIVGTDSSNRILVGAGSQVVRLPSAILELGTSVADAGTIRLPQSFTIYGWTGTQRKLCMKLDAGGSNMNIADSAVVNERIANVIVDASASVLLRVLSSTMVNVNGTGVAFNGQTPAARPDYTVTNLTTDRSFDADTALLAEVADVLGTLITDLVAIGLLQ